MNAGYSPTPTPPLLEFDHLTVALPAWADQRYAVHDLSFTMARNEIVCVIGESGSGKSITVRAILGLLAQPHVRPVGGALRSWDENLLEATAARMRQGRGQAVAMVFQEPMTALNPLMTVGRQIGEMAAINKNLSRPARRETVLAMLEQIQLPNTGRIYCAYLPSRPCVGH